ncbi:hypothetical protein [Mycoplasmopsis agassizii]|uniref:hypothetical protein n=1 Tax=Mycoplasmopsis agassizii TaxID=33922 RepID=UPI0015DB842F|nr:hypothetical protein [Mycoplasmopsis agassizii]
MKAGFVDEQFCRTCNQNNGVLLAESPRTTSFLIPVEKGKITDFNMNDSNIVLTDSDL